MCYFSASVGYDFYFGQHFEQTTNISIAFSKTGLQKKNFNENFWRSDNRGCTVQACEDLCYCYSFALFICVSK